MVQFSSVRAMRNWLDSQRIEEVHACRIFCNLHETVECPRKGGLCDKYVLKATTLPQVAALSRELHASVSAR
jgi:hypothetical protein